MFATQMIRPIEGQWQSSPAEDRPYNLFRGGEIQSAARRNEQRPATAGSRSDRRADELIIEHDRPRFQGLQSVDVDLSAEEFFRHADRRQAGDDAQVAGDSRPSRMENAGAIDQDHGCDAIPGTNLVDQFDQERQFAKGQIRRNVRKANRAANGRRPQQIARGHFHQGVGRHAFLRADVGNIDTADQSRDLAPRRRETFAASAILVASELFQRAIAVKSP